MALKREALEAAYVPIELPIEVRTVQGMSTAPMRAAMVPARDER